MTVEQLRTETERLEPRTGTGFVMRPGEARDNESRQGALNIFGDQVLVKLAGEDTGGGHSIMEVSTEPQCGPPLHRHDREDESFYVLESEYRFVVDGREILAGPGSLVFAPRGSVHTFQNIGEKAGRMVVVVQPAGLDTFFTELALATHTMAEPDHAVIVPIFHQHGLELLGPPLSARG